MMVVLVDHLLEVNRLLLAKQLPHKTVTRSTSAQLTNHTKKDHTPSSQLPDGHWCGERSPHMLPRAPHQSGQHSPEASKITGVGGRPV